MIPQAWPALVLALAAYRITRLAGWDDFPLAVRVRAWATGEVFVGEVIEQYRRPTLAHWIHCPFCVGFWISVVVYLAWLGEPRWALYAAFPFAVSGFVGLIAKNLDP